MVGALLVMEILDSLRVRFRMESQTYNVDISNYGLTMLRRIISASLLVMEVVEGLLFVVKVEMLDLILGT